MGWGAQGLWRRHQHETRGQQHLAGGSQAAAGGGSLAPTALLPAQQTARCRAAAHRPAARECGCVCEGCMGQVQQVLNQQAVLHRHLHLDLCRE